MMRKLDVAALCETLRTPPAEIASAGEIKQRFR